MENLKSEPKENLRKYFRAASVLCVSLAGLAASMNVNADLTWFSRANCVNNESISWHAWNPEWLWTNTYHFKNGTYLHCDNNAGNSCAGNSWQQTWWGGAVHWNEGLIGGFYVIGDHWRWSASTGTYLLGRTSATGCNPTHF